MSVTWLLAIFRSKMVSYSVYLQYYEFTCTMLYKTTYCQMVDMHVTQVLFNK